MMQVETIRATPEPEKLSCQAARGDYYDGFVPDADYEELMESVQYDESHVEAIAEIFDYTFGDDVDTDVISPETELRARQYALLERLFRRGHWGPFEHPQITLGIEGISRSCMAQLTRHRHASFDVQSQRYVDFGEKEDPVEVPKSLVDEDHFSRETGELKYGDKHREQFRESYEQHVSDSVDEYEAMVDAGVPKEDARFVLPIGTAVNMTVSVNARTLIHIEDMRAKADAQWEIRELTNAVHDEFAQWMPMTTHLYEEHGPHKIAP
jgi:thymidylate synthase (FAD)